MLGSTAKGARFRPCCNMCACHALGISPLPIMQQRNCLVQEELLRRVRLLDVARPLLQRRRATQMQGWYHVRPCNTRSSLSLSLSTQPDSSEVDAGKSDVKQNWDIRAVQSALHVCC